MCKMKNSMNLARDLGNEKSCRNPFMFNLFGIVI